jgi:hypothetical protein
VGEPVNDHRRHEPRVVCGLAGDVVEDNQPLPFGEGARRIREERKEDSRRVRSALAWAAVMPSPFTATGLVATTQNS